MVQVGDGEVESGGNKRMEGGERSVKQRRMDGRMGRGDMGGNAGDREGGNERERGRGLDSLVNAAILRDEERDRTTSTVSRPSTLPQALSPLPNPKTPRNPLQLQRFILLQPVTKYHQPRSTSPTNILS